MTIEPSDRQPSEAAEIQITDYLQVLAQYRVLVIVGPIVFAVIAFAMAALQTPIYQASTTIVGQTASDAAIPAPAVIKLRSLVQSTPVIEGAVAGVPAAASISAAQFASGNLTVEHLRYTSMLTVSVRLSDAAASAAVANRLAQLTIDAYHKGLPADPAVAAPEEQIAKVRRAYEERKAEYDEARAALVQFKTRNNTDLIRARLTALMWDPFSAEAEAEAQLEEQLTFDATLAAWQQTLTKAREALASFRTNSQLGYFVTRRAALQRQLAGFDQVRATLEAERAALVSTDADLAKQPRTLPLATPPSRDGEPVTAAGGGEYLNPVWQDLAIRAGGIRARVASATASLKAIEKLEAENKQLSAQMPALEIELARLESDVDQAAALVNEGILRRNRIPALKARLESLRKNREAERAQVARLPGLDLEVNRLQAAYDRAVARLSDVEALMRAEKTPPPVPPEKLLLTIATPATAPAAPIAPKPARSAALGAVLGLLVSVVGAFVMEHLRTSRSLD